MAESSGKPPAHTGRFTFVEWDKDQPTNRSLSTQHVTREIRRQKRLRQQEAAQNGSTTDTNSPRTQASSTSPSISSLSSVSPAPTPSNGPSRKVTAPKGKARIEKTSKQRKQPASKVLTPVNPTNQPSNSRGSGLSIWQLLSNPDDDQKQAASKKLIQSRIQPAAQQYAIQSASLIQPRDLPSPINPLTSHRGFAIAGPLSVNPLDKPLLDFWLATAPNILRLNILAPSQTKRKPAHEVFFPMASRATEALEHIIMLPAALVWAKSAGDHPYVAHMLNIHRARCVKYLNDAISRLVDNQVMEDYTHIGLMSLIWAENMYGDARQARAYSLVFREMVQLRLKQRLAIPRRESTVIAHWYNALTTVDFWPKGNLSQKEILDAENLLRPIFPFLESARHLARQRRHTTNGPLDCQKYLGPISPIATILLSSHPFDTSMDSSDDENHRYLHLLLFRVLLFLHVGLLHTASISGPDRLTQYFENLEQVIRDMDILLSPSPLALLLWAVLSEEKLSTLHSHREVAMWIYPVRRLGTEWLARLNRLLLTWLGLTHISSGSSVPAGNLYDHIRSDWEAEQLPLMLTNLVIGDRTPTPEVEIPRTFTPPGAHEASLPLKRESPPLGGSSIR